IGLWRAQHGFGWSNLESGWPLALSIVAVLSLAGFVWRVVDNERDKQADKDERADNRRMLTELWRAQTQTTSASGVAETATGYVATAAQLKATINIVSEVKGQPTIETEDDSGA
ncbi:MAG TPA: hypothetical protein VMU68_05520, partial [Acidimicrobiales bacterium]|nr:hypothetical protein [Acidimicrobiales bacterium]